MSRLTNFLASGFLFAAMLSCSASDASPVQENTCRTQFGESKPMGNGTIQTFLTSDKGGRTVALGVIFPGAVLTGLPDHDAGYQLAFPKGASTVFNHFEADWNAHGHVPTHIYDIPHFDFHFYILTPAEREKITLIGKDMDVATKTPKSRYIPDRYITAPGTSWPKMGTHWFSQDSPEFHGKRFTQTFIYGYYDAKLAFLEPMITIDYLISKPDIDEPIPQPTAYQKAGWYPTRYVIAYDPMKKGYVVSLKDFVWRSAK